MTIELQLEILDAMRGYYDGEMVASVLPIYEQLLLEHPESPFLNAAVSALQFNHVQDNAFAALTEQAYEDALLDAMQEALLTRVRFMSADMASRAILVIEANPNPTGESEQLVLIELRRIIREAAAANGIGRRRTRDDDDDDDNEGRRIRQMVTR
jgi:hypothetical protein